MTSKKVDQTIRIARQHFDNGNVDAAMRIMNSAIRAAQNSRAGARLYLAKTAMLDVLVDATVAKSQVSA